MGRLDFYLHPSAIAVIGASAVVGKVGYAVLHNIIESGFTGRIYPINPRPGAILGHDAFRSVLDVPGEIDIAVLCIPARLTIAAAEECGQKGVKGLIVVAAGFREIGGEGAVLEQQLKEVCARYSLRCIGPNALGNITTAANMSFSAKTPLKGKIAMLSQSGAMMTAVLDWADTQRIGFSHFISLGNKMDVDEVDFISEIADDAETSILILYLESVEDGEKFMEIVPAATRKKPVVILKSGTSAAGKVAASSHTGALAGDDIAFDLAFERSGVIRARTMKELFDFANLFDRIRDSPPLSSKFVIITNAGGPGIIATDAFEHNGIPFAAFTEETIANLQAILPPHGSAKNPVDIVGDAPPSRFRDALTTVFKASPEVCAGALVLVTPQSTTDPLGVASVLVEVHTAFPTRLIVATFMGGRTMEDPIRVCEASGIPCYQFPEPAAASLRQVIHYRQMIAEDARLESEPVIEFEVDHGRIAEILGRARGEGRLALDGLETSEILGMYGVNHPKTRLVTSPEEARAVEDFPVAMKIASPDILHKSDCGGVRLDVASPEEAAEAFSEILENATARGPPGARIIGVEVQQMVAHRGATKVTEVIVGMNRDPHWGPLVMVGSGGIYANFVKDIAFELGRGYSRAAALAQLRKTKVHEILEGVRGEPRSDVDGVLDVLTMVAHLAVNHGDIASLDINPVLVFPEEGSQRGVCALDIKILLQ
jgi:acetyltransferase